nr:MAG TPA: major tail protein [Caudoviricetes sp.]
MGNFSGVYPCYKNQFQIGDSTTENGMKDIADMETFSIAFDNGVEEWTPYETEGWIKRLMTSKSVTISCNGKRNVGDAGNDMVAGMLFKNGTDVQKDFQWTFPDGTKVVFGQAIVNVTSYGAADSTNVAPLEFEIMSNGKPTVTVAA